MNNCVIENIPIQADEQYALLEHCLKINYLNITYSLDKLVDRGSLYFEEYIGPLHLTGNELLYYPSLAKKLQSLKEYPRLERRYPLNTEREGIPFVTYFADYLSQCFQQFQADLKQASRLVSNLIQKYGQARHIPIIDRVESCDNQNYLLMHGIRWRLAQYDNDQKTQSIRLWDLLQLRDLLGHSYQRDCATLEEAAPGTPFIALRIQKTWKHKGRVMWFDLNTCKPVSKAERTQWQPPLQEKIPQQEAACVTL